MSRLIDADSLISLVTDSTILGKGFVQAFVAIVDGEPTVHPEPHWIPVAERLPEDDTEVFVYLFGDRPYIAWRYNGKWHTDYFEVDSDEGPIAWMPLPEPFNGVTT